MRFDEESSFFQHLFSAGIFPEEDGQYSSWIRGSTLSHGPYSDLWKRQARARYQTEASARHTVSERLDNKSWEVWFLQETAGLHGPSRGDGSVCNMDTKEPQSLPDDPGHSKPARPLRSSSQPRLRIPCCAEEHTKNSLGSEPFRTLLPSSRMPYYHKQSGKQTPWLRSADVWKHTCSVKEFSPWVFFVFFIVIHMTFSITSLPHLRRTEHSL